MKIGMGSKVKIRIAQNIDTPSFRNFDTKDLEDAGAAEVFSDSFRLHTYYPLNRWWIFPG